MTPRPWWMGRPFVWAWMVGLALTTCGMRPCPAQVAPLAVTLHTEAPCPAPAAESPLLRLPTGCPAPWAGWLYTPDEHTRTREGFARLDAAALAEAERADVAHTALVACRVQRDEVTQQCVAGVAEVRGRLDAIADLTSPPEPVAGWVYALAGGLAGVAGSLTGLAGDDKAEALGMSIGGAAAGAAVGTAVVWLVEWASR